MNNIYVLNKNYKQIGVLSNQGANPQAPYYEDLYVQELETGADTYQFSTVSNKYTQDLLEIGNHIMFAYKNRSELFTITSLEYSHNEGYKTIGVYAEGIGFDLLEIYMKRPENEKEDSSGGSSSGGSSSGSGGSNSGGGMDNDNDGDDNTDDEYADVDDVYVDENGIIIYDKYGQDDYADPDNVSVDENGIIIYRRNKHNRKKDSLEFKNISYSRFLSILLKNTGWSYVCQPGLESIKHDITVRYDTNIFALLQDSMQSYRGVELEFVHELVGGRVQKVIKAYKDGGRGSFVGKRFEYGTNVRGITKTQEVANSEDDTILYIDNVGINVQYDVDFALKSAEVPEIEIGDTHYVIDRDFYPPMTIKARIGKIEISFSDPTVNKIYLANNKRISGSAIEDELDEDDIAGIIDDYEFDDDGGGYEDYVGYHTHDFLKDSSYDYYVYLDRYNLYPAVSNRYNLGTESFPWNFAFTNNIRNKDGVISPRFTGYNYHVRYDRGEMKDVVKITNSGNITKQDLLNFIVHDLNVYEYDVTDLYEIRNKNVDDPNAYFDKKYLGILSDDVVTNGKTSRVGDRVSAPVVTHDTNNDGDSNADDTGTYNAYNMPALLSCLIGAFQYYVSGGKPTGPTDKDQDSYYDGGGGDNPGNGDDPDDPSNPGGGSYGKLICEELRVERADGSAAQVDIYGKLYVTEEIKCDLLIDANDITADEVTVNAIVFSDGSKLITAKGGVGGELADYATISYVDNKLIDYVTFYYLESGINEAKEYADQQFAKIPSKLVAGVVIDDNNHLIIAYSNGETADAGALPSGSGTGGNCSCGAPAGAFERGVSYEDGYDIEYLKVKMQTVFEGGCVFPQDQLFQFGDVNVWDRLEVLGTGYSGEAYIANLYYYYIEDMSDEAVKENIRYLDASAGPAMYSINESGINVYKENLETRDYSNEDLLEKADLYDFIVNQLNICEYNYIGNAISKIGLIANEYEGTKVGDRLVSRNEETDLLSYSVDNLLFATIGALQEEVRIKDEKIASLEDRLARIEAMLGINNDN